MRVGWAAAGMRRIEGVVTAARRWALALVLAGCTSALAAPVSLVSVGDPSPLGLPFSRFSDVALDDQGRIAFVGGSTAIFHRTTSGIERIVAAGDVVLGRTLAGVDAPAVASGGCLAFRAVAVGGTSMLVRRCGPQLVLLAEVGDAAPGGGTFASLGEDVVISSTGQVAFTALFENGGTVLCTTSGDRVFTEIVRTGSPSPAGGLFTSIEPVGISAAGRVGFRGSVSNGPDGLFYWTGSALARLAVVGDSTPAGGSYSTIGFGTMNESDAWAFRATVSNDIGAGVFRASSTTDVASVQAVVRRGDASPLGGVFGDFPTSLVPSINDAGAIAFRATLDEADQNSGIFLVAPEGDVSTVVAIRTEVNKIALVRLREVTLGDDGDVVVRATLADGTPGLFLARDGAASPLAVLGNATDLGAGFRFADASARDTGAGAVFLGVKEAVFVGTSASDLRAGARLGDVTPLRGTYAGVDPPAAGAGGLVFGVSIRDGRSGEAIFSLGKRGLRTMVRTGIKLGKAGRLVNLFSDPLDDLARPGVGRGGIAFQAGLTGGSGPSGVFVQGKTGRPRAMALAGKRAPGSGLYRLFGTPAVVGTSQVYFVTELSDPDRRALVLRRGRRHLLVARAAQDTRTRLGGRFFAFDTPVAGISGVAFKATLQDRRDAIFFARGTTVDALVATGETDPAGGRFRTFGRPAVSGDAVIVRADVAGATSPRGLYRISTTDGSITTLAPAGSPSPIGGTFLSFGTPTANHQGAIAYTADLLNAPTATTIIVDAPND